MLVVGGGVSGGVKGAWPGLTDTDSGDVRVVNDYRAVLSEVLTTRMRGANLSTVFPGFDTSSSGWLGVTAA
jgi:predicted ABC-type transport system involved in lysophospholipase L1 biosynthesis ATPase subunit